MAEGRRTKNNAGWGQVCLPTHRTEGEVDKGQSRGLIQKVTAVQRNRMAGGESN